MAGFKSNIILFCAIWQAQHGYGYYIQQAPVQEAALQQSQIVAPQDPHLPTGQGGIPISSSIPYPMYSPFQVIGIHHSVPIIPHSAVFSTPPGSHKREEFYHQCGKTTRFCEYLQHVKPKPHHPKRGHQTPQVVEQVVEGEGKNSAEIDYACYMTSHICVGATENCIANKNCDVALKVTEVTTQWNGKTGKPVVISVSHLNNCHMDGQSTLDAEKEPQMLFAVGFATYDESGESLECRHPKASDFKLIFLWKNSTVEDPNKANCHPKKEHHRSVNYFDAETMTSVYAWPKVCKSLEKKEGKFDLKTFLTSHTPTAKYTSFFSPPYSFAENFEPEYTSNGMVISGVVSN